MHLFDIHAHFPMHTPFPPMPSTDPHINFKIKLLAKANDALNYENGVARMASDRVAAGAFGGFASVLYDPEDEFLVGRRDPRPEAIDRIEAQAANVETEARRIGLAIAKDAATVERCLQRGERFLIHCVEGGFACGGTEANVRRLARLGVAYLILAHCKFRNVATCASTVPHMPDAIYHLLNPQLPHQGLTRLGKRIAEAAIDCGIILDVTHCTDRAQAEVFRLAERRGVPVIASHTGARHIADYEVNLSDDAMRTIAGLGGVIGTIIYPYWLQPSGGTADGLELVARTIDHIAGVTGGWDHVAIGTDMDGFIQPVRECPNYAHIGVIEEFVRRRYESQIAENILWRNALRVLQRGWTAPRC
jgi:microsomal dipeptidase-like Zn-dependent dipeptidase